jgi:hypothetical protein
MGEIVYNIYNNCVMGDECPQLSPPHLYGPLLLNVPHTYIRLYHGIQYLRVWQRLVRYKSSMTVHCYGETIDISLFPTDGRSHYIVMY